MSKPALTLGPIVGGLSDTSVNLWGRTDSPGILRAWLGEKEDLSDALQVGISFPLQLQDGYAGVAPVSGLKPETTYFYDLRLDDAQPPIQPGYPKFTTFPVPGKAQDFSFVFGSCFRPAKENGGIIFQNLDTLRSELDNNPTKKLRFILLIGDQIYADDWDFNGLWLFNQGKKTAALTLDDYRNVYQYTWSNQYHRTLLKNLPAFMTLDDHEVDDDWRWTDPQRLKATFSIYTRFVRWLKGRPQAERILTLDRVRNALKAYWEHQAMHAPLMTLPPKFDADGKYTLERHDPGSLAYTFTYGAAAFFVMDTRSMRVKNMHEQRMLGDGQWHILKEWLLMVKDEYPVKFVVTSSSVLYSMFGDFLGDRWSGFRSERDTLLRFIGDNHIENIYLIAGDLHSSHSMTAECGPRNAPVTIHEFCSTPFEQVCNKYARLLYTSIKTGAVHHPKRHFVVTEPNYGIVRVHFQNGAPQVDFRLYGIDGQLLAPK
jgi:phosphodiesterase/alkaline phosphatase D-like protein